MTNLIMTFHHDLKTQGECNEAMRTEPLSLAYVSDRFKTQEMCNRAVRNNPAIFFFIRDHFKKQEMCNEAVEVGLFSLGDVPDYLKTQ